MKKRALISVFDKTGILPFATELFATLGYEIISTGGTASALRSGGVPAIEVADITGFPEMLDGRLKMIHPKIAGGVIADAGNPDHINQIAAQGINRIHIVVVNFYDFNAKPSIERIDVGGPTVIRAAAKNFESCIPIIDPSDYMPVLCELKASGDGNIPLEMRFELAQKVFEKTRRYETEIAAWWPLYRAERLKVAGAAAN